MRILLSLFIFISVVSIAQKPAKAPLKFRSYGYSMDIAPSEALIVATKVGEVAYASGINDYWTLVNPEGIKNGLSADGPHIENVNFFNADTGIVAGFISHNDAYKIIYRTTNRGKNWETVDMGQDGWVDDAVNLTNGEAWLSISGSGIAYSKDYGITWSKIQIPEKKQRFATIFFNPAHEAIIGSLWNMLAYSRDNGDNWKLIPTPLDQGKYNKLNKESRPALDNVAIFKDHLLVTQEGLVFWSGKDTIDWHWLKGYTGFYTDVYNTGLYFKSRKGDYVRSDHITDTAEIFSVNANEYRTICRNGKLFLMCGDKIVRFTPGEGTYANAIYTNQPAAIVPNAFAYTVSGGYGNIGNKIYHQKDFDAAWEYWFELPFNADSGSITLTGEDNLLYTDGGDSLYYYNISTKKAYTKSRKQLLTDFSKTTVKKITFNQGSSGCFHNYNNSKVFYRQGNVFEFDEYESKIMQASLKMAEPESEIAAYEIDNFVKRIPVIAGQMASVNDLGFTVNDYEQCKKDILEFKESLSAKKKRKETAFEFSVNNLDFDKLLSCVDSVKNLDTVRLNSMLISLTNIWSTTTNWVSVVLVNDKEQQLVIMNRDYEFNNYHFPWQIALEGSYNTNTSIEINNFLQKVYPGFITNDKKMTVLHQLVKNIYNQ